MPRVRKDAKNPVVIRNLRTGLYYHLEQAKLDKRTGAAKALAAVKAGLMQLFPEVNTVALLLIDRICYKSLKLTIFEGRDLKGQAITPGGEARYISMANSLRTDLELLVRLSKESPAGEKVPSLQEYLAALKSEKLQLVEVTNDEKN